MMKPVTTLAAGMIALGLAASAPSAAQANPIVLAPAAAAAWLAGGILGGAVVGTAVANAASNSPGVTPAAGVTVNSTTCYFRNRLANPVNQTWIREQVCTTEMP
jgi:hypothetical protein